LTGKYHFAVGVFCVLLLNINIHNKICTLIQALGRIDHGAWANQPGGEQALWLIQQLINLSLYSAVLQSGYEVCLMLVTKIGWKY